MILKKERETNWALIKSRYFRFSHDFSLSPLWIEQGRIYLSRKKEQVLSLSYHSN